MITLTMCRSDDPGSVMARQTTMGHAFTILMDCELGFGGHVVECSPTRVRTETPIFGHCDLSTFEGPEAEMAPLVALAAYVSAVRAEHHESIIGQIAPVVSRLVQGQSHPYMLAQGFGGFLYGAAGLRESALFACGVTDPTLVDRYARLPRRELAAALEMALDEGTPAAEVLAVLA